VTSFDEIEVWSGRLDRFDWKLVGKQEMFIPYNNNKLLQPKTEAEILTRSSSHLYKWSPNSIRTVSDISLAGPASARSRSSRTNPATWRLGSFGYRRQTLPPQICLGSNAGLPTPVAFIALVRRRVHLAFAVPLPLVPLLLFAALVFVLFHLSAPV